MFISEYPDGTVLKGKRRVAGYKPHKKKRTRKRAVVQVPLTDSDSDDDSGAERSIDDDAMAGEINLSDISSDEGEMTSDSQSLDSD